MFHPSPGPCTTIERLLVANRGNHRVSKRGNAVADVTMANAWTKGLPWRSEETVVFMDTICSPPAAKRPTVITTSLPCMVVVSPVIPLNVILGGRSSLTWVPFNEYRELFRRVTVKVRASPGCTRSGAESIAETESSMSCLVMVHLSSSAEVPVAREE